MHAARERLPGVRAQHDLSGQPRLQPGRAALQFHPQLDPQAGRVGQAQHGLVSHHGAAGLGVAADHHGRCRSEQAGVLPLALGGRALGLQPLYFLPCGLQVGLCALQRGIRRLHFLLPPFHG